MNYLNLTKMTEPDAADGRWCDHCGAKSQLALSMLDPVKGHLVRVFRCDCGEEIWSPELRERQPL